MTATDPTATVSPRQLVANVHIDNPETAEHFVFGPGDVVPAWAVALITNPLAWAPVTPESAQAVPGSGQFMTDVQNLDARASGPPAESVSKTHLYGMDWEALAAMADEAGIAVRPEDTKQQIIEALTAR